MIPGVSITIKNGQLGQQIQTKDSVVGLVCTGLANNLLLNTPVLLTSLDDYKALVAPLFASTWTRATTTATITTPTAHGLATGNSVTISVTSDAAAIPLGIYTVTVLTSTTYTITCLNAGTTSGTATTTVNQSLPSTFASTWTRTTTTATITTPSAHGLSTGHSITISVTSDATAIPLGIYAVTVLTGTTFTITCLNAGTTSGTVTAISNMLIDTFALKHVTEFYNEGGKGSSLFLMLVAETQTMVQTVDNTNAAGAKKLLDYALGEIKVLGIVRNPTGETSVGGNFFRADVISAIAASTAMITAYRNQQTPFRILLGGRVDVTSNVPQDLKAQTNNAVGVICGDTDAGGNAAVGLVLGKVSKAAVSTSIARVKDGTLVGIAAAYIGATLSENFSQRTVLIDKGAITITTYFQRTGYYLSDDQMCASPTDDYTNLVGGRVVDKAQRITYQVYVDELHNSLPIDPTNGRISPEVGKSLEGKIEQAVNVAMAGEISDFDAFIPLTQNIISSGKLMVNEGITPLGYMRKIDIGLGLVNPYK